MPRDEILEELPRRWDFRAFAALKRRWGVSLAALLYRARELGRLTENSYRWAVTTLSRQHGRRKEPIPLGPVEQPKLLSRAAELAFGPHYQHALAAELHLSLETIDRLVDDIAPTKWPGPRYGNSAAKFDAIDTYVNQRLAILASAKHGLRGWNWTTRFDHGWVTGLGVYRLSGTVRPTTAYASR